MRGPSCGSRDLVNTSYFPGERKQLADLGDLTQTKKNRYLFPILKFNLIMFQSNLIATVVNLALTPIRSTELDSRELTSSAP